MAGILTPEKYAAAMRSLKALFGQLYAAVPMSDWLQIATLIQSSGEQETYAWLGATPMMREWKGGKAAHTLLADDFVIRNKDYEATLAIHQNAIADDSLGQYKARVADLAARAKNWAVIEVMQLIRDAATVVGYDGVPLVSDAHVEGESGTQDNDLAGTGTTVAKLQDDLGAAYAAMAKWKDDRGNYLEPYVPDTVIVPANGALLGNFMAIQQGNEALGSPDLSQWVKRILVNPYLTDANDWYAVCTSRAVKAVVVQERQAPTPVTPPENSGSDFEEGIIKFSVEARGAVVPGDWRCIVRTTNA